MVNRKRVLFSAAIATGFALFASHAWAAPSDPPAMVGEVILKAAPGMSEADVRVLADSAGCDVVKPIEYTPGFYLLRLRSVAATASREAVGMKAAIEAAVPPSAELDAAIATLRKREGVLADPNYVRRLNLPKHFQTAAKSPALARPLIPLRQTPATGRTRATAPPSSLIAEPNDPLYPLQYGLKMMRLPEAYAVLAGVRPVVVGVADTGIDVGHPDFYGTDGNAGRVVGAANFFPDTQGQPANPGAVQDLAGHGTHVAGTIAAITNNRTGVASVAGWNTNNVDVRVRVARVFGAIGGSTNDIVYAGVGYLISSNVDVINLSLGAEGAQAAPIELDTINRALAAGITVVAAAGNSSLDNAVPGRGAFPADIPGVIKVTSVGRDGLLASYSNFGGPVAVAAPGGDQADNDDPGIISTWPRLVARDDTTTLPQGYYGIQGTSMAAPHVAGLAGLLIAVGAPRDPVLIKKAIMDGAQPLPDDPGGRRFGSGLADAYSTLLPYLNPPFSVSFATVPGQSANAVDLGTTYNGQTINFSVTAVGVANKPAAGGARIRIFTATFPSTLVREFLSDTTGGFTVPALGNGQLKSTPLPITLPEPVTLPPGKYRIELTLGDRVVGTRFLEVTTRTQPGGRVLFSTPFQVRLVNPTAPEQHVFGGTAFTLARYNPLRLPGELDYALFQSAGGRRDINASFSAMAPDGSPLVYDTSNPAVSVAPVGLGYWLNLSGTTTLNTSGPPVGGAVAIKLYASGGGWNQIGAPYVNPTAFATSTVVVDGVSYSMEEAVRNGVISTALVGFRNGDYVYQTFPDGILEPFNGYWVRVFRDCTLIVAPTGSTFGRKAVTRSVGQPKSGGWRVRFGATVAGDTDGQNYFGQSRGAKTEVDALDIAKPPSGAGHAYVRFQTPQGTSRAANAFDIRPLDASSQEWEAAVSTDRTNADVTLTWDGLGSAPRRAGFTLVDTQTGREVDMRGRSAFTFRSGEAGSTRVFRVVMKPQMTAGVLAINGVTVTSTGRGPGSAGIAVRFNTTRAANIIGRVTTIGGRTVSNLTGTTKAEPTSASTLRWDGRTGGGYAPAGPYLIEITARTEDGQTATYKQTFISNQ